MGRARKAPALSILQTLTRRRGDVAACHRTRPHRRERAGVWGPRFRPSRGVRGAVRPAGAAAAPLARSASAPDVGGSPGHRVRVGPWSPRAAASPGAPTVPGPQRVLGGVESLTSGFHGPVFRVRPQNEPGVLVSVSPGGGRACGGQAGAVFVQEQHRSLLVPLPARLDTPPAHPHPPAAFPLFAGVELGQALATGRGWTEAAAP